MTLEGEVGSLSQLFTILSLGLFWCDVCHCNSTICLLTHQVHPEICLSDLSLFLKAGTGIYKKKKKQPQTTKQRKTT